MTQLNRRAFLVLSALATGDVAMRAHSFDGMDWSFLERPLEPERKRISVDEVKAECVPFTTERDVGSKKRLARLGKEALPMANQFLRSKGQNPGNYNVMITTQKYCRPCKDQVVAENVRQFCDDTLRFLYQRLPNLVRIQPTSRIALPGEDYSHLDEQVLIGDRHYTVLTANVVRKGTDKKIPISTKATVSTGCYAGFDFTRGESKVEAFQPFIEASPFALVGIPSEVIPRTTTERTLEYSRSVGLDTARIADETLVEGISEIVTAEMIDEFNIPDGHRIQRKIREFLHRENSVYAHVPESIAWLRRNGIEKGLEMYLDDPKRYMDAIK